MIKLYLLLFAIAPGLSKIVANPQENHGKGAEGGSRTDADVAKEKLIFTQLDLISRDFMLMPFEQRQHEMELMRVGMDFTLSMGEKHETIASLLKKNNPSTPELVIEMQTARRIYYWTMMEKQWEAEDPNFDKEETARIVNWILRDEFMFADDDEKRAMFKKLVEELDEDKRSSVTPTIGDGEILKREKCPTFHDQIGHSHGVVLTFMFLIVVILFACVVVF